MSWFVKSWYTSILWYLSVNMLLFKWSKILSAIWLWREGKKFFCVNLYIYWWGNSYEMTFVLHWHGYVALLVQHYLSNDWTMGRIYFLYLGDIYLRKKVHICNLYNYGYFLLIIRQLFIHKICPSLVMSKHSICKIILLVQFWATYYHNNWVVDGLFDNILLAIFMNFQDF